MISKCRKHDCCGEEEELNKAENSSAIAAVARYPHKGSGHLQKAFIEGAFWASKQLASGEPDIYAGRLHDKWVSVGFDEESAACAALDPDGPYNDDWGELTPALEQEGIEIIPVKLIEILQEQHGKEESK